MITATLKKKIIATLGKHYSKKIIPYLVKKEVFNREGLPYKPSSIQNIVTGQRENDIVELHILNLLSETQLQQKKLKEKKSKILKKK